MKKEEIHLEDIKRILLGLTPPEFLIEVLLRTLIVYIACLIFIRWLGKRMSGQISITEMAVMIMIGAIISVPVQFQERGLLQGFFLLLGILVIYNGLNLWEFKKKKISKLIHGSAVMLVKDGALQLKELEASKISKQQLFSALRHRKIFNLGRVKRVYLEACGLFSIYEEEQPKAGLSLFPPDDDSVLKEKQNKDEQVLACANCGYTTGNYPGDKNSCKKCGNESLLKACQI